MKFTLSPTLIPLLSTVFLAFGATAADAPITNRLFRVDIQFRPDSSRIEDIRMEVSPSSAAAAARLGQMPIAFNPTLDRLDILDAHVRKPDGSKRVVDPSAVRAQLAPGVPNMPMYQDIQQKVLIFPDLQAGDTLVVQYRREATPLFPGYSSYSGMFDPATPFLDAETTISAPPGVFLQGEALNGPVMERTTQPDGGTWLVFRYQAPQGVPERIALAPQDRRPRFTASTFPGYTEMAAAYQALNAPKQAVTPRIQALADKVTAGAADKRKQAQLLHDWVSLHIRYVALYLGRGGVEPHMAEAVMDAGYGDCKDHVVLLGALLDAKGIPNGAALVNLGNAYTLSGPPTLAQLNHVITYLPEWDIYTDSTVGTAAFGVLPLEEHGKPAVHVGVPGPAVRALPMGRFEDATIRVQTSGRLLADGSIEGTTETVAGGALAIPLRLAARAVQAQDLAKISEAQLRSLGQTGTGSMELGPLGRLGLGYDVTAKFTLEARPELMDGEAFAPPVGLQLLKRPGDYLLGPIGATLDDGEPTPCFAGQQREELALELPKGRVPARLPAARRIEQPLFSYSSRWSLDDGPDGAKVLRAVRTVESRVTAPVCEGEVRRAAAVLLREVRRDHQARVSLGTMPE